MNLNGNLTVFGRLKEMKIELLAVDPSSPLQGRVWFNTAEEAIKYYDGTSVQTVAKGGNLDDYLKIDGTVAMTGALTLNSADQSAGAATDATAKGYVDGLIATKQDTLTGATTSVVSTDLAASRVVVSDGSGKIAASANATAAEVEHLAGVTSPIQTQLDSKEAALGYTPVDVAGDTMSGNLAMGGNSIVGLAVASDPTSPVRLQEFEAALAGLDFQPDVLSIQTDNTLDPGVAPTEGDRYIIGDSGNLHANFGTITGVGDGDIVEYESGAFVIAYDVSVAGEGALAWDRDGDTFKYFNGTVWSDFGGLAGVTAGVGLSKSGNDIYVNLGAGVKETPSDEVGLDLYTTSGLMLTEDGTSSSLATGAQLSVQLDGSTLSKSVSGVKVAASGVTATEIASGALGNGLAGGDGVALNVVTAAGSGITVDGTGVSVDDVEMATRVLYLDGSNAMTSELTLSSTDQSAAADTSAISKGHLDTVITSLEGDTTSLETRMENGYFVYDGTGAAATSHTVTHNMGNQYVQVTVVDSSDDVVLPESISYTDANSLVVTFTTADTCRVIVTGLKAAA